MENFNEFLANHHNRYNRSNMFLYPKLKKTSTYGVLSGFIMIIFGYYFIIFKEWFFCGFATLLFGAGALLFLIWQNNQKIISFLEDSGYNIDKKWSPLNSKELENERMSQIIKYYESYDIRFLEFISKLSKEESSFLAQRKFPLTSIASKIGVAFMTLILNLIMKLEYSLSEKLNWILFFFFISIILALLGNFLLRKSFTPIDARIKKYEDFKKDIENVIFRRLSK